MNEVELGLWRGEVTARLVALERDMGRVVKIGLGLMTGLFLVLVTAVLQLLKG